MTCVEHSWWFPSPCPKCNEPSVSENGLLEEEGTAMLTRSPLPTSMPPTDTLPGVELGEEQSNDPMPSGSDNPRSPEPTVPLCVVGSLDDPPYLQRNPDGSWKYPELRSGPPNVFVTGQGWMKPT